MRVSVGVPSLLGGDAAGEKFRHGLRISSSLIHHDEIDIKHTF